MVDFYHNTTTSDCYLDNWTEIKLPDITIYAHAQGITGLNKNTYVLPVANYYIDPNDPDKLLEYSGGKIQVKRINNNFVVDNYESINFPETAVTVVTSAAGNSVVGVYVDNNQQTGAFQEYN
jgi:formylmethanofuran dehydrogenase subunit D